MKHLPARIWKGLACLLVLAAIGLAIWLQPWCRGDDGGNSVSQETEAASKMGKKVANQSETVWEKEQSGGKETDQRGGQESGAEEDTGRRPLLAAPGRDSLHAASRASRDAKTTDGSAGNKEQAGIDDLLVNARESYAGREICLQIFAGVRNVPSGSILRVELTDAASGVRASQQVSVNRGQARLELVLPADLASGDYSLIARVGDLEKRLSYRILEDPSPAILNLSLGQKSQIQGDEVRLAISGKTKNLPDQTSLRLRLTDSKGAFYTVVRDIETSVRSNTFQAQMTLPAGLPEGDYCITAQTQGLVRRAEYRILRRADRRIKGIVLSQNSSVAGDELDLAIQADTADLSRESGLDAGQLQGRHLILAELLRKDGTSLSPKLITSQTMENDRVQLKLHLPGQLTEGSYRLRVSVPDFGLLEERDYTILHRLLPELKDLTADRNEQAEKTKTSVSLSLQTVDMADEQRVCFELVDAKGKSLLPRVWKEVPVRQNRASANLIIPAELPSGDYQIRAVYGSLELTRPYRINRQPVPEIIEARADKHRISFGYAEEIQVKLRLRDISAGSDMRVSLLKEDGSPVKDFTEGIGRTTDRAFEYQVKVPALEPGKYLIRLVYMKDPKVAVDIDLEAVSANAGWNDLLDYNGRGDEFYWFDEFNKAYPYKDPRAPYDPKKPTVIFVHGWQNGSVKENWANDFKYVLTYTVKEDGKDVTKQTAFNSAKAWVDAGYNVGVYNWVQIADEPGEGFWRSTPYSAEAKIWTCNYTKGGMPMRYRLKNGKFIREARKTAADLFVDKYLDAMKGYQGDYIEFGGHSLGNQMVLRSAYLIQEKVAQGQVDRALMPHHLTLLDPYYSGTSEKYAIYQGQKMTNSEAAARIAQELVSHNVIIEMFKSSKLTTSSLAGDVNAKLENVTAYNRIHPDMFGFFEQAQQHNASYQFYYWSKAIRDSFYHSTEAEIASRMGVFFRREQNAGMKTADPGDDRVKIQVANANQYISVKDLTLTDDEGRELVKTDREDCDVIATGIGQYRRMSARVRPTDASARVVTLEKVSGDLDAVQLAYDGNIKGLKKGNVLLRAHVITRDQTGEITGSIEKYFRVRVG